jgi:phage shock protein A
MSFMSSISQLVRAKSTEAVEKVRDENRIPILNQEIIDLESRMHEVDHACAMASANVVSKKRQIESLSAKITHDRAEGSAAKAAGDIATATNYAHTIAAETDSLNKLNDELVTLIANAKSINDSQSNVQAKHDELVARVRELKQNATQALALRGEAKALQGANEAASQINSDDMDSLAGKIEADNDLANEEFKRATASFAPPPSDPLANKAAQDILNSL